MFWPDTKVYAVIILTVTSYGPSPSHFNTRSHIAPPYIRGRNATFSMISIPLSIFECTKWFAHNSHISALYHRHMLFVSYISQESCFFYYCARLHITAVPQDIELLKCLSGTFCRVCVLIKLMILCAVNGVVCIQFTYFSYDGCENTYTLSYYHIKSEVRHIC